MTNETEQADTTITVQQAGRELAEDLIEAAVRTAKTHEQMASQIAVLASAAVSILSTVVYNRVRQFGEDADAVLADIISQLHLEYEEFETTGEAELLQINDGRGQLDS